jgi:tRNA A37 threonylcarbamoyltransferase TsaD
MRKRLIALSAAIGLAFGLTLGLIAALALAAQTPSSKLNELNGHVVAQAGQTPFSAPRGLKIVTTGQLTYGSVPNSQTRDGQAVVAASVRNDYEPTGED